jgi:hypothetical protein
MALCIGPAVACEGEKKKKAAIDDGAARASIIAQINAGIEATRNKNADGYIDQIPDGVVMRDARGDTLSRDSLRAQILRSWASIRETRALDAVVDTIILRGDSATVITTMRWDRLVFQPNGKGVDTVLSVSKQSERWHKTPKGWRAFNVTPMANTVTVNGHPVIPMR